VRYVGRLQILGEGPGAAAILHLVAAARLLGGSPSHGPIDTRVPGQVLAEIQRFEDLWSLALGLFGVHLLLIGGLAFTSGFVQRFIGVSGCDRWCRLPG
jgi:hypothetical protein